MKKIPLREGMFTNGISGDLVGFRCKSCNHALPPLSTICFYCRGDKLERLQLSRYGKLHSYATVYMSSGHFEAPYIIGYIDLPEGIRMVTPLKERAGKPFKVGMDMELVVEKLWDEGDEEVIGPKFQPV
jgi:uncharacterized OB-fold protein